MKSILASLAIVSVLFFSGIGIGHVDAQNRNSNVSASDKLQNPLKFNSVEELIPKLIDIVAQVGLVVCTFFIILAGFHYVTANGDPGKITKAHNILLWAVVGTAVLLGARVLASILMNTVNQVIK